MGEDTLYTALESTVLLLIEESDVLRGLRDSLDRSDPRGRHLSIAITTMEDAILRLRAALDNPIL